MFSYVGLLVMSLKSQFFLVGRSQNTRESLKNLNSSHESFEPHLTHQRPWALIAAAYGVPDELYDSFGYALQQRWEEILTKKQQQQQPSSEQIGALQKVILNSTDFHTQINFVSYLPSRPGELNVRHLYALIHRRE